MWAAGDPELLNLVHIRQPTGKNCYDRLVNFFKPAEKQPTVKPMHQQSGAALIFSESFNALNRKSEYSVSKPKS